MCIRVQIVIILESKDCWTMAKTLRLVGQHVKGLSPYNKARTSIVLKPKGCWTLAETLRLLNQHVKVLTPYVEIKQLLF